MISKIVPKVVFMGEKPLGHMCLKDLFKRECKIIAICTRKECNDLWWGEQKVRTFAENHGIPLIERRGIISIRPDIIISVLYPYIIEADIIESAKFCYNLHLAPLPEYKGCNCGSHALINGDKRFGVTLHFMTSNLDNGAIIEKRYFPLSQKDTAKSLYEKAVKLGYKVWMDNIDKILKNRVVSTPIIDDGSKPYQRNSLKKKKIPKINDKERIYNFVRALDFEPFEPAYFLDNKGKKIHLKISNFNKNFTIIDKKLRKKFNKYLGV